MEAANRIWGQRSWRSTTGLWQQAAAEGISAFVSSGDAGAAGCYSGSSRRAAGTGVNGLCSSQYATCVGGTEFDEGSSGSKLLGNYKQRKHRGVGARVYPGEGVERKRIGKGARGCGHRAAERAWCNPQPAWQKGVSGTAAFKWDARRAGHRDECGGA